jgi:MFS family permease
MTQTALSIISATFTEGSERNKALGIWSALGGVGATTAWLIGGPLVDRPGWRWIFFINIPVGLAALALPPALLGDSRAALPRRSYDPAGALTITGALVLLVVCDGARGVDLTRSAGEEVSWHAPVPVAGADERASLGHARESSQPQEAF